MGDLHAHYRDPAGLRIEPDLARLEVQWLHLVLTDLGALDLLAEIGAGLTYGDLEARAVRYRLDDTEVWVLELEAVIETKAHANREKDRAVLPTLRQTLALKKQI